MNCAFHPINDANVRCCACERPLCPACDHRIKGIPSCQDCIMAGIEELRRSAGSVRFFHHQSSNQNDHPGTPSGTHKEEKSPLIAVLIGFVPGLGAAYNGQNIKALTQFLAVAGLWCLADIFGMPLAIAFGLGAVAFYFYTIFDAFQSAQRLRRGENIRLEDDRLKLYMQMRMNLFGVMLIGLGALVMLNSWIPNLLHRMWPVMLIIAGAMLVWNGGRSPQAKMRYRSIPPSAITSRLDSGACDLAATPYREQ